MLLKNYINLIKEIDNHLKYKDGTITKIELWRFISKPVINIIKSEIGEPDQIGKNDYYRIDRNNVFNLVPKKNTQNNILAFYTAIMMWGYSTGGRGNNVFTVLNNTKGIISQYNGIMQDKENKNSDLEDIYTKLYSLKNYKIESMGPSTFTKVLYFPEFEDKNKIKSMILDDIMIRIIKLKKIDEINNLLKIKNIENITQSARFFQEYCEIINDLIKTLDITAFGLEYFLFYVLRTLGEYKI